MTLKQLNFSCLNKTQLSFISLFLYIICTICINKLFNLHQTWHLLLMPGFILDPTGHLKSAANSFILENVPITLNCGGEWTPVVTNLARASGLYLEHQTLAALIQNNCCGEKGRPGNSFSGPLSDVHCANIEACQIIHLFTWNSLIVIISLKPKI